MSRHHRARNEAKRSSVEFRSLVEWVRFFSSALVGSQTPRHCLWHSQPLSFSFWSQNILDPLLTKSVETLVDATTHRCRASIRTLNGPLLGPVQVGVRSKAQVHHQRDGPGIVGVLLSNVRSYGPSALTQSPEQGGGCRRLPNFLDSFWFSRHQRMSAPWSCLLQESLRLVLPDWCVPVSARLGLLGSRLLRHRR
jgi:hypothetical protein